MMNGMELKVCHLEWQTQIQKKPQATICGIQALLANGAPSSQFIKTD